MTGESALIFVKSLVPMLDLDQGMQRQPTIKRRMGDTEAGTALLPKVPPFVFEAERPRRRPYGR
jgi:hypothetical protein